MDSLASAALLMWSASATAGAIVGAVAAPHHRAFGVVAGAALGVTLVTMLAQARAAAADAAAPTQAAS